MEKTKNKNAWLSGWLSIGVIFGSAELIVNAFYGRFPLFLIKTGDPAIAIPLGSLCEVAVWLMISLFAGSAAELLRRIFRQGSSIHLGAQIGCLLCLEAYVVRSALAVGMRNGLFRDFPPPEFNDFWILFGVALTAIAISVLVAWNRKRAEPAAIARDRRRIALFAFVLAAGYAIVYNRWMSTTVIPLPSVWGWIAGVVLVSFLLDFVGRRKRLTAEGLARWMGIPALISVLFVTVYYSWPSGDDRPNIIVSLWDAARASRMSICGYEEETTPGLDSLASRGVVFEAAYTPSNFTFASHVSFFLGKSYREHNYHIGDLKEIERYRREFTLADYLRRLGYHAVLFTENAWVPAADKGFDEVRFFMILSNYSEPWVRRTEFAALPSLYKYPASFLGRQMVDAIRYRFDSFYSFTFEDFQIRCFQELILRSRRTGPVFLFWNWMTVHQRYYPHENWRPGTIVDDYDYAHEYSQAMRYIDKRFMDIYRLIEKWDQLDGTIFIVTSDHGEFLGENNLFGHNKALFRQVLQVPLVVLHPSLDAVRIKTPVSLTFFRSLVESLVENPGRLNPELMETALSREKKVVAEHGYLPEEWSRDYEWCYTVVDDNLQYIYDPLIPIWKSSWPSQQHNYLFELRFDPEEKFNVYDTEGERVRKLREYYADYLEQSLREGKQAAPEGAWAARKRKLRDLGYLK